MLASEHVPTVLGIDVCLGQCAAAVLCGDEVLFELRETMTRGHVERLSPMVRECLAGAGVDVASLDLICVTRGPGSFTGARLGAAFARGLALASGARTVGVTAFETYAGASASKQLLVALDGGRGEVNVQAFVDGESLAPAMALDAADVAGRLAKYRGWPIAGSAAAQVAELLDGSEVASGVPTAADVARQGIQRFRQGRAERAVPLYLRAPDAKLPA